MGGLVLSAIKKKIYFSPPTCKQINSILSKGWKPKSINSTLCIEGDMVSGGKSKRYFFSFEKCDNNEKYYCLQCFMLPALFSEEEYDKLIEEMEGYQKQGAYIISAWHIKKDKTSSLRKEILGDAFLSDNVKSNVINFFEEEQGFLYYIILPISKVKEQDKEQSYDGMLKYLAFRIYANIDKWWLIIFLFLILNVGEVFVWGMKDLSVLQFINLGIFLFYFFYHFPDYYYFFRYRLYRKEYSVRNFLRKTKKKEREMRLG